MSETFLMRDVFSAAVVEKIADDLQRIHSPFDTQGFLGSILPDLENQGYSERKNAITDALIAYLPDNYEEAVDVLIKATPPPYAKDGIEDTTSRFYVCTYTAYISRMGVDHYDLSMRALHRMTQSFTAEWDLRTFLLKYTEKTLALLKVWAKDENQHVRRLVSEGSRPNLPWGKKLKFVDEDPENTTLPILFILQNDKSEYVRRSVANHLNDLTKNNGDLVVRHLQKWRKKSSTPEKERMIHHALRTLIKQGHRGALKMIGYSDDFDIELQMLSITSTVKWGGQFNFEFRIRNKKDLSQRLLIDFVIGFQKKDGSISPKVFKLKKVELASHEMISLAKGHSFKPITTRVYYPGKHLLTIQINGKKFKAYNFTLQAP